MAYVNVPKEGTMAKYISEQDQHDIALDKLNAKEYDDPFRGQTVIQTPFQGHVKVTMAVDA